MKTNRLKNNPSVLVQTIVKDYDVTYYDISKVFNVKLQTVERWVEGKSKPNRDILRAMVFAYRFMLFWRPFTIFLKLIFFVVSRPFVLIYENLPWKIDKKIK